MGEIEHGENSPIAAVIIINVSSKRFISMTGHRRCVCVALCAVQSKTGMTCATLAIDLVPDLSEENPKLIQNVLSPTSPPSERHHNVTVDSPMITYLPKVTLPPTSPLPTHNITQ